MREDLYDRSMVVGSIYHVYNRGVAKQPTFLDETDYRAFLESLSFYLDDAQPIRLSAARASKKFSLAEQTPPQQPLARIHAYCLMPNHFHLLLEEITDGGISRLLRRAVLSYTRYFNVRHSRVGPLFQGNFRFVPVLGNDQFLHVSRYIHLNPYVAHLTDDPTRYPWFSYPIHKSNQSTRLCDPSLTIELAGSPEAYREFLLDFASYARDAHFIKSHMFEEQE